ncbi:protoporphyrinogen/coproporphyrinogen oxidase [Nocardia wallacei]|uniref:protoporphyrinogen/coproporphyrinogen oxidase n=1 Tax=Nocardia wallacei TaxID=480035 RepID=UPI002457F846|nr:FAD-dependent oxidoreductase [Nocardia wallacei]
MTRIIVIGAGAAGAAAAYKLAKSGSSVTVLEREDRVGGRIRSDVLGDVHLEGGAQFLASFYTNTLKLIGEIGLQPDLFPIDRSIALAVDGRPLPILSYEGILGSRIIPWKSKLNLVKIGARIVSHWRDLDFHDMGKAAEMDVRSVHDELQSMGDKVLLDNVVGPALNGFLYYSAESTSVGFLDILLKAGTQLTKMYAMRGGMERFVRRLLDEENIDLRTGATVRTITPDVSGGYTVEATSAQGSVKYSADGIVIATTATEIASIISTMSEAQSAFLPHIRYSSTVSVASHVSGRVDSPTYACMVPMSLNSALGMVNVLSRRDARSTPPGTDVISLFASGRIGAELCTQSDREISNRLFEAAARITPAFDVQSRVNSSAIFRWPEALPLFDVGHLSALRRYGHKLADRRMVFAGDYLGGPFIEGAVSSGLAASEQLNRMLQASRD